MPVIREYKFPKYLREQHAMLGPCVAVGMEIWEIIGPGLRSGFVERIDTNRGVLIVRGGGQTYEVDPMKTALFVPDTSTYQTEESFNEVGTNQGTGTNPKSWGNRWKNYQKQPSDEIAHADKKYCLFYHGTSNDIADKILKEGLVPQKAHVYSDPSFYRRERGNSIFMAESKMAAATWADHAAGKEPSIVFEIRVPAGTKLHFDDMGSSRGPGGVGQRLRGFNDYFHEGKVPPEWITRYWVFDVQKMTSAGGEEHRVREGTEDKLYYVPVIVKSGPKESIDEVGRGPEHGGATGTNPASYGNRWRNYQRLGIHPRRNPLPTPSATATARPSNWQPTKAGAASSTPNDFEKAYANLYTKQTGEHNLGEMYYSEYQQLVLKKWFGDRWQDLSLDRLAVALGFGGYVNSLILSVDTWGAEAGRISINGKIKDKAGHLIAAFSRTLGHSSEDGERDAYHAYFEIPAGSEDLGIGTKHVESLMKMYDVLGVKTIKLNADVNIGKYAWARMGWDFAGEEDQRSHKSLEVKEKLILYLLWNHPKRVALLSNMDHEIERINSGGTWHAWDFANFKIGKWRAGKRFMLQDSSWDGIFEVRGESRHVFDTYIHSKTKKG